MNIDQHINNVIKHTKIKFFRRDFELAIFGIMSYKYEWIVEDYPDNIEGFVMLELNNGKSIDGYIHINKKYIGQPDYTPDNLIGLIVHELSHIFRRHGIKLKGKNKEMYNLACDHIIDRSCRDLKVIKFYKDQFNIIPDLDDELPNCTEDEAYKWLMKQQKSSRFQSQNNQNSIEINDSQTGETFNVGNIDELKNQTPENKQKLKEKIEQVINNARATNNILEQKGRGSGSQTIKDFIGSLLAVQIDWTELLKKAIKTNIIMKPNDRSWRKINHYYSPHNITLPGCSMEEQKENIGILIGWVDISGSISKKELKKFAYVINESLNNFEEVVMLVHNTRIVQTKIFNSDNKIEFMNFIKNIGFKTGGGTSHTDCYKKVQKEYWDNDNEIKDRLSMIISLTDGYSDIEDNYTKFKWCKSVPTVIICTTGKEFVDKEYNLSTINVK